MRDVLGAILVKRGQGFVSFKAQSDGVRAGELSKKKGTMNPSNEPSCA